MTMGVPWAEGLASALIVTGAGFALVGSWGLVRLPSLMERLHGPTKATTLGLGAMLAGAMVWFQLVRGQWTTHELLVSLFLFVTAPITASMIAKVHLHRLRQAGVSDAAGPSGAPPPPAATADWATYEAAHRGSPADFEQD